MENRKSSSSLNNPTTKKAKTNMSDTQQPTQQEEQQPQATTVAEQIVQEQPIANDEEGAKKLEKSAIELSEADEARVKQMLSVGEECIQEEELRLLVSKKPQPICYDGFEPSGRVHIAQGIMKAINVNKLTDSGCKFIFLVADWFALMNNKMGGDLKKIQTVGKYMIEVWKSAGMNLDNVEFVWSSQIINEKPNEYWMLVLDIARKNNLARILRCSQIMGRSEKDDLSAAQIFYPCMQCADIFFLKADICQLGMDQRKVNVLAREYCDKSEPKRKFKPVILSHHMLLGLTGEKMSKSDPRSAIFMEDSETEVNSKIKSAFCPEKVIDGNPVVEYVKYIIFPRNGKFEVERSEKNGGNKLYEEYETFEEDFKSGALHPGDVKPSLAKALNGILQPVRDHFKNNAEARKLLDQVKKYRVTK